MGGGGTSVGGKYVNPSEVVPKSLYWVDSANGLLEIDRQRLLAAAH